MTKQAKIRTLTPKEIAEAGGMCAWDGCTATFEGELPTDWRWLLLYWQKSPDPVALIKTLVSGLSIDRHAALCPGHTQMLGSQLKDLMRRTTEPPEGSA